MIDNMNKKILLIITGSIAAYKTAILTRLLIKSGAEVQLVATTSALDFITPLTLATLSKRPVLSAFFEKNLQFTIFKKGFEKII